MSCHGRRSINRIMQTFAWQGGTQSLGWQASYNRGVSMNPVDHPHGGGEGARLVAAIGQPWGVPTKAQRSNKATDKFIMRSRHQRKSGGTVGHVLSGKARLLTAT